MKTRTWKHGVKILGNSDILRKNQMKTENGSPGDFPSSVTFAHHENVSFSFVLLMKKQTEVIHLQTD